MKILLFFVTILILLSACSPDYSISDEEHFQEVEQWHQNRVETLKGERGWLKLAGLFWIDQGTSTFGSDSSHPIVFPEGSIPENAGYFNFDGDLITFFPAEGVSILADNKAIETSVSFSVDESPEFTFGRLAWTFLQRDELTGLRLFDQESEVYKNFRGIERFPVDQQWRTVAKLIPYDETTSIPIVNILGQTSDVPSSGILEFELQGETYRLETLEASGGDRLFLIIGDHTNRENTYQGGRYMYVDNPGPNKTVVVDFNMAYNPPCAFSEFTTCQLPPPANRLSVAIEAGEKRY
jgi:uncharacterized protein (DUF1684 family)